MKKPQPPIKELSQPFECHLTVSQAEQSGVELLARETGLSKQRIKQAMHQGAVWRSRGAQTQRQRRGNKGLRAGDILHLYYDPQVLAEEPPAAQLLADEGQYSLWYKPYGMRSQGSKWGDHCTINRWAELHLQPQRPAFVVHRLDRAATGLILIAHEKRVAAALSGLFAQRAMDKRYRVIVRGHFPETDVPHRMTADIDGKAACSHARLLAYDAQQDQSLLEVVIETGRKHQIRRHLAGQGFPVVGDRLHGRAGDEGVDLQLTACYLAFRCPVSGIDKCFELPESLRPQL